MIKVKKKEKNNYVMLIYFVYCVVVVAIALCALRKPPGLLALFFRWFFCPFLLFYLLSCFALLLVF